MTHMKVLKIIPDGMAVGYRGIALEDRIAWGQ